MNNCTEFCPVKVETDGRTDIRDESTTLTNDKNKKQTSAIITKQQHEYQKKYQKYRVIKILCAPDDYSTIIRCTETF